MLLQESLQKVVQIVRDFILAKRAPVSLVRIREALNDAKQSDEV